MIYECLVYQTVTAGCWIDTAKVPVAQMVGAGIVQALEALEHKFQVGIEINRFEQVGNLARNLIGCKRMVDCACAVNLLCIWFTQLLKTSSVSLVNE